MKRFLKEDAGDSPVAGMLVDPTKLSDSLDSEIDARIVKYENESMLSDEEAEENKILESLASLSLRALLEQDEEQTPAEEKTDDSSPATPEKEDSKLPLDLNEFTSKIVRLVNHAVDLLPVQQVIVTRAMNYLRDNYDQSYADQMEDILNNQYGFDLSGEDDVIDVPISVGAGTKSAGG